MIRFSIETYEPVLTAVQMLHRSICKMYNSAPIGDIPLGLWCYFNDKFADLVFETAYAAKYNLTYNHEDDMERVKDKLTKHCKSRADDSWIFDGFTISLMTDKSVIHKGLWYFKYHEDLPYYRECNHENLISGNDILKIIGKTQKLKEKPRSIELLEEAFNVKAERHRYCFGQWSMTIPDYASIYCNPLGLDCGLSYSADNFCVWYFNGDKELGYQSITDIASERVKSTSQNILVRDIDLEIGTGKTCSIIGFAEYMKSLQK